MTLIRLICLGYFAALLGAAALNYIPGLTDDQGRWFGIVALDSQDDALHLASALWALTAALWSHSATPVFLLAFGAIYPGDGLLGLATDQDTSTLVSSPTARWICPSAFAFWPTCRT